MAIDIRNISNDAARFDEARKIIMEYAEYALVPETQHVLEEALNAIQGWFDNVIAAIQPLSVSGNQQPRKKRGDQKSKAKKDKSKQKRQNEVEDVSGTVGVEVDGVSEEDVEVVEAGEEELLIIDDDVAIEEVADAQEIDDDDVVIVL